MARQQLDLAKRLDQLGFDPLETMVRIAHKAEASGNLVLAAKIASDMIRYMAPKLKTMELDLSPDTQQFLDRQARQERIRQLALETGIGAVIDGEFRVLQHVPKQE